MVQQLMLIFFGSYLMDDNRGGSIPAHCARCDNVVLLQAYKWRKVYHVLFVPILPTTAKRELVCPVCSDAIRVDKGVFRDATQLIDDTTAFFNHNMSAEEYANRVDAVWQSVNPGGTTPQESRLIRFRDSVTKERADRLEPKREEYQNDREGDYSNRGFQ